MKKFLRKCSCFSIYLADTKDLCKTFLFFRNGPARQSLLEETDVSSSDDEASPVKSNVGK